MANKEQKLFAEFPPVSTETWEAAINKDLKGADYEKKLVWRTAEGFNVRPYYRAENLAGVHHLGSQCGEFPFVRGVRKENNWKIVQSITVDAPAEANAHALRLLTKGVESICFVLHSKEFTAEDLDLLLGGVSLKNTELIFKGCGVKRVAELFLDKLDREAVDADAVRASFVIDPIINKLTLKGKALAAEGGCKGLDKLAVLIQKAAKYKKIRLVGVSGEVFQNCGSTIVQELAFTLAAGHEYLVQLMDRGLSIDQIATTMRFSTSISANYFMEIAKLRAARLLWANITAAYAPKVRCAEKMQIHAVTSRWNMTVYDAYVNMLRATTEAMSAAVAGVHSLEVLPFDVAYEKPTDFSERIAHNVQLLLKEESHFNQVVDAAGGSYYIENLTQSIAEQAWALFKQVEDKGGYMQAFLAGFVQEQVEASAAKKRTNIATRREALLGTNQFPNFGEVADAAIQAESISAGAKSCSCSCHSEEVAQPLRPFRGAEQFEQMRLRTDRSGREPKAFMLTVGSLAFARARAQFSCNFFACAGIRVMDNTYFQSVEEGVKAAMEAKADIVVICASDDDYPTLAPEAAALVGDRAIFVVAGAPACKEELEAKGIKNFISVRSNVLDTLNYYLTEMGI